MFASCMLYRVNGVLVITVQTLVGNRRTKSVMKYQQYCCVSRPALGYSTSLESDRSRTKRL